MKHSLKEIEAGPLFEKIRYLIKAVLPLSQTSVTKCVQQRKTDRRVQASNRHILSSLVCFAAVLIVTVKDLF